MRDLLLARVREKNWPECEKLLYEHWSRTSVDVFAPNVNKPWDAKVDDSKISQFLFTFIFAFVARDP